MIDAPDALKHGGHHPRPQLVRDHWADLSGPWEFARDPEGTAVMADVVFPLRITVPFAQESAASGIGETGFCRVVWYRRTITEDEVLAAGLDASRPRLLLRFGAVDHEATVWADGVLVGSHRGGQTPFAVELHSVAAVVGAHDADAPVAGDAETGARTWTIVVRAERPPLDLELPRGKQDWHESPHSIWYHRRTGIWQPVWLEAVPVVSIDRVAIVAEPERAAIEVSVELGGRYSDESVLEIEASYEGASLGSARVVGSGRTVTAVVPITALENGQARDELSWSPEHPRLVSLAVRVQAAEGGRGGAASSVDVIGSYAGIRSVGTAQHAMILNGRPRYIRAVLEQGYWPESHYTAPSAHALRAEVESIIRLGFDTARVHQKAEDPRFLYWADRLGLMVWAETANAYRYSSRAAAALTEEWTELVLRDRSHPSIITWVPINESWGVQDVRSDPRQQAFARGIADLTRALDGTRPVLSNDGWEHTDSDLWTIHDYHEDPEHFRERYATREQLLAMLDRGPDGRAIAAVGAHDRDQPFLLTEFGGIKLADAGGDAAWGWTVAADEDDLAARLAAFIAAVRSSDALAGFCYTQLTDTEQEMNGLLTADRRPKGDWAVLRAAITSS